MPQAQSLTPPQLFSKLEREHGLPAGLLDQMWLQESQRGDPKWMRSPAGAEGHFGLMPPTVKALGVKDPYNLEDAARGAAAYMAKHLKAQKGDLDRALVAYNWGQGNLARKGRDAAPAESNAYSARILEALKPPKLTPQQIEGFLPPRVDEVTQGPDLGPVTANPHLLAQGRTARTNLAKKQPYERTQLDAFLGGMFGDSSFDAPEGSVLDPAAANRNSTRNAGYLTGLAFQAPPVIRGGLKGAGALLKVPALEKAAAAGLGAGLPPAAMHGSQRGAVSLGGADDLLLTHAFDPAYVEAIAKDGFLRAPSLGITTGNQTTAKAIQRATGVGFNPGKPRFVFRAGAVNPETAMGTLINRDGYFANPTGRAKTVFGLPDLMREGDLQQEIADLLARQKSLYGLDDLRLGEGLPGSPSRVMQIAASPNFKSWREFEASPAGAETLRHGVDSDVLKRVRQAATDRIMRKYTYATADDVHDVGLDIVRKMNGKHDGGPRLSTLAPFIEHAKTAPSDMAEFKVLQHLPLRPSDAFIWSPYGEARSETWLKPLMEKGFRVIGPDTLHDTGKMRMFPTEIAPGMSAETEDWARSLLQLVPPTGELKLPPRLPWVSY